MRKIYQILLLFFVSISFAQNPFDAADSIAIKTKYNGDLNQLVLDLTGNFDDDIDKTRAIYSWITQNISYDYKLFNKGQKSFAIKSKNKTEYELKKQKIYDDVVQKVLRKRKGICSGYSLLFKKMSDIAGIKSLYIDGYVKTKMAQVGKLGILDHAWNAVIIDGESHFLDLTWASGFCESGKKGKLINFTKKKNDFYWFTDTEKFTIDHFPKNPEEILYFDRAKEDYKNQPYIAADIIPYIEVQIPKTGILNATVNDTLRFSFKYLKDFEKLQINTNSKRNPKIYSISGKKEKILNQKAMLRQEYVSYQKIDDSYEFYYVVENQNLRYLEILFDHEVMLKYLVKIDP